MCFRHWINTSLCSWSKVKCVHFLPINESCDPLNNYWKFYEEQTTCLMRFPSSTRSLISKPKFLTYCTLRYDGSMAALQVTADPQLYPAFCYNGPCEVASPLFTFRALRFCSGEGRGSIRFCQGTYQARAGDLTLMEIGWKFDCPRAVRAENPRSQLIQVKKRRKKRWTLWFVFLNFADNSSFATGPFWKTRAGEWILWFVWNPFLAR